MTTKKAYRYDPSASYEVREHDLEYLNVGGVTRQVRIYQPEGPGPFPMLLSIHGGAWTDKDHTDYASTSKPLAATGLVVASIAQRVGAGFPYPLQLQDIHYGVRWLKAHAGDFNGDPDASKIPDIRPCPWKARPRPTLNWPSRSHAGRSLNPTSGTKSPRKKATRS